MYRLVEYSQNPIGRFFCSILPEGFKPAFREGDPIHLTGKLETKKEVIDKRKSRLEQLKLSGRRNDVCIDIEKIS